MWGGVKGTGVWGGCGLESQSVFQQAEDDLPPLPSSSLPWASLPKAPPLKWTRLEGKKGQGELLGTEWVEEGRWGMGRHTGYQDEEQTAVRSESN